jgi:hypothetical protein
MHRKLIKISSLVHGIEWGEENAAKWFIDVILMDSGWQKKYNKNENFCKNNFQPLWDSNP